LLQSAPEGSQEEGPFKVVDNSYTSLHTVEEDGVELLPEIDHTDLPLDMWGMGIMTLIVDLEDTFFAPDSKEKLRHFVRLMYVAGCGILNLLAQASIPLMLYYSQEPLIPGWAANTYDPLQANYTTVPLPGQSHSHKKHADAVIQGLQQLKPKQVHHSIQPLSQICPLSQMHSIFRPCGPIGYVLAMFLLLWIAQMLRQLLSGFVIARFVINMPKVNPEYGNMKATSVRPCASNHVMSRNRTYEVFATTGCTKGFIVILMLVKAAFHGGLGYLGCRALMATSCSADLIFTFLALWFVGIALPTPLVEALLPWAMDDVKATKFANYEGGKQRQQWSISNNVLFGLLSLAGVAASLAMLAGPLGTTVGKSSHSD